MNKVELTTMCAVIDGGKVLMINRKKNWKGWAFIGGHLEDGESIRDCIIREVKEETGLAMKDIRYKGFTYFYNSINGKRHIVNNFICTSFTGITYSECSEGKIAWIDIKEINNLNLAEGMTYRLPLFFEKGVKELYIEWNKVDGYTKVEYRNM